MPSQGQGQGQIRIRTEEQLARKREADRLNHRARREKERNRVDRLEAEIVSLRSEVESLRAEVKKLRAREEAVAASGTTAAATAASAAADCQPVSPTSEASKSLGVLGLRLGSERPTSPLLARFAEEAKDEHHNCLAAKEEDPSPPLPRTELVNLLAANYTPAVWSNRVQPIGSTNQWPLLVFCICGIDHKTKSECLEYASYKILLRAHAALLHGTPKFTSLPKNPSLENLFLQSEGNNPIVDTLVPVFQNFTTMNIPVLFGLYILVYRLLRWRLYPDSQSYADVPTWYRPSSIQENIPHVISIDYLPWPALRDFMAKNSLLFLGSAHSVLMYIESIRFAWPPEKELVVKSGDGQPILNPEFDSYVNKLENWKICRSWADMYPDLAHLVVVEGDNEADHLSAIPPQVIIRGT